MPVSYDGSALLKCSVQMTYIRYVMSSVRGAGGDAYNPFQQAQYNSNGLRGLAAAVADAAVDRITGSDFAGDIVGSVINRGVKSTARNLLGQTIRSTRLF